MDFFFYRSLICLKEFDGMIALGSYVFDKETFWIQCHKIPLGGGFENQSRDKYY